MDFNRLMAKMRELDGAGVQECGEPMGMTPPMPAAPPVAPPSMSVNLNAQGMDNIESLLKLITKVNPDAAPVGAMGPADAGLPSLVPPGPSIASIKPELPPLKMLPDFDKDEPEDSMDEPGDDKMNIVKIGGDDEGPEDDDNKVDMFPGKADDEGDDEEGEEKEKEEATDFQNASTRPDPKEFGIDKVTHNGTDLNREKGTYPKVAGGDNPMQKQRNESGDLRAQIRAELLQRLAEAKGAK